MIELMELCIENFRSFLKPQTINFKTAEERKVTALYGSNAAGKSNVIKAIKALLSCITHSANANWKLPYQPFLLNSESIDKPTSFKLSFRYEGRFFSYSFSFDSERIVEETLLERSDNSEKNKTIFSRNENKELNSTAGKFKFGKKLADKTRVDTLIITKAREDNNEFANIVFDLVRSISVIDDDFDPSPWDANYVAMLKNDNELKDDVIKLLSDYDFAIRDIVIKQTPFPEGLFDTLPIDFPQSLKNDIIEQGFTEFRTVHFVRDNEGTVVNTCDFDLNTMESTGTQKFLEVAVPILDALNHGKILFVDEFSSHIHPNLASKIINMFKSEAENKNPTKLVIITHNTAIMSELERDEIYIVNKLLNEETHITPLSKANARKTDAFEKRYRAGYYTGIPKFKD